MRTTTRAALAAALTIPLIAGLTVPAVAGTKSNYRSTGSTASVQWIEFGTLPGVDGNVHSGFLDVSGDRTVQAWGFVTDWTCRAGELPPGSGGGHEEPPPSNCDFHSERFIQSAPGDLKLRMDKKLSSAQLTGTVQVSNHGGGGGVATPTVDITWTGVGATNTSTYTDESVDEFGNRWFYSGSQTTRQAEVSGRIGAMDFDEADDIAYGRFGTYKFTERSRVR
jgi:hypothetical protein